jgi:hypothetical protein
MAHQCVLSFHRGTDGVNTLIRFVGIGNNFLALQFHNEAVFYVVSC